MADIINRLRYFSGPAPERMMLPTPLMLEAAKEIESLRTKLAEAEKDSALLNEADRVGHVDAKFASIREELEWVMTQNFESLDAVIVNELKTRSE